MPLQYGNNRTSGNIHIATGAVATPVCVPQAMARFGERSLLGYFGTTPRIFLPSWAEIETLSTEKR
jgi:hypothetical protein